LGHILFVQLLVVVQLAFSDRIVDGDCEELFECVQFRHVLEGIADHLADVKSFHPACKDLALVRLGEVVKVREEPVVHDDTVVLNVFLAAEGFENVFWARVGCAI
jgi:hypothetical protein